MTDYYVDSVNGSDSNSGTSSSAPKATLTQVNALTGDLSGVTIYLARGSEWRDTLNFGGSSVYGSAGSRLRITAYGSGDKPLINGSDLASGFAQDLVTDPAGRLYKKTAVTVDVSMFYDAKSGSDKRIDYVTWNTDAATTFAAMSENTMAYDSANNIVYVWLAGGVNPNGVAEISNQTNLTCMPIVTTAGHIEIDNIHAVKGANANISISTTAGTLITDILIHDNLSEYAGVDGASNGNDGIIVYGDTTVVNPATKIFVYDNVVRYCINNAVEFSYVTGAVVYNNQASYCGGNLCELWSDCHDVYVIRNLASNMSSENRTDTSPHSSFVWTAPNGTSDNNWVIGNVAYYCWKKFVHHQNGTLNVYNNTFIAGDTNGIHVQNAAAVLNGANNIIVMNTRDAYFPNFIWIQSGSLALVNHSWDHNIYWELTTGSANTKWKSDPDGVSSATFAAWQGAAAVIAASIDQNSVESDPLVTDAAGLDFSISALSPAAGAGTQWWGTNTRPQAWNGELLDVAVPDIGGYQIPGGFYPSQL